jgi:hypothetical protein
MFMDQPITPTRVEAFVDLLRGLPQKRMSIVGLKRLFQPKGLPGLTTASQNLRQVVAAAKELELVREVEGQVELSLASRERRPSKEILLAALDAIVLQRTDIEPWFSKFYAFLIARSDADAKAAPGQGAEWEVRFNEEVLDNAQVVNRFNSTKYNGFRRWMRYMGLGWHDSADVFQPNPYERLRRKLTAIFLEESEIRAEEFMRRLALACPELDGGRTFLEVNRHHRPEQRECTGALAAALVELHLDGVLELDCPVDSSGWSLRRAVPPIVGSIRSERFDRVRMRQPVNAA